MIEMRWVWRVDPNKGPERVLQYRTWKVLRATGYAHGGIMVASDGRIEPEWSDWQDVPTVKEGA